MKKFILLLFLFLAVFMTFVSCTTAEALFKANLWDMPVWYYLPEYAQKKSVYAFVCEGESSEQGQRQAYLIALNNVIDYLERYLGHKLSAEDYKELSTTGKIARLKAEVINTAYVTEDNLTTCMVRVVAPKKILEANKTQTVKENEEFLRTVNDLVYSGDEYIKNNSDILGAVCYMKAMVLLYGRENVAASFSFDSLMQEVINILSRTTIDVLQQNSAKASCRIQVKSRESTYFRLPMTACPVRATYKTSDGLTDSFVYYTNNDGIFDFEMPSRVIAFSGSVEFSYDIEPYINAIEKLVGSLKSQQLREAFENSKVFFDYKMDNPGYSTALAALDYDELGERKQSVSLSILLKKYAQDGIKTTILDVKEDETIQSLLERVKGYERLLVLKTGISVIREEEKTGKVIVVCEAVASLYDVQTGNAVYETEILKSAGFGTDRKKAEQDAFTKMSEMVYSLIREKYV